ncbi:succinyldiaminopimelate transaminase [Enemella evansiae]|nr:succinyldiaminopimelate transaminase [Enemella evansiae]
MGQLLRRERAVLRQVRFARWCVQDGRRRRRSPVRQGSAPAGTRRVIEPRGGRVRQPLAAALPDFPWDTIAGAKQRAAAHPDGIINLSVGTPVDPVPEVVQRALIEAADSPGYPVTIGTPRLRQAMADFLVRRCGVQGLGELAGVPAIGTKEIVANLPSQLGLGSDDTLIVPSVAYPTYAVGGGLSRSRVVVTDDPDTAPAATMAWINSPSNPTGAVSDPGLLRGWVNWAREHDAILASDECYLEFGWEVDPVSVMHPDICGDSHANLLVAHSLSKRSNLAGYRAGFVAGDPALLAELLEVRKHAGFIMPEPVQAAMAAALDDEQHVAQQRERYRRRRAVLRPALEAVGFTIEHSEAGLYLWVTRGESGRASLDFLAEQGILAAPGDFYGNDSADHLRVALTATDERIDAAAQRLAAVAG